MKRLEIPVAVLGYYITGCLNEVKDKQRKGTLGEGFIEGVGSGIRLADDEGGLSSVMEIAVKGLRLRDPKFGSAYYPKPKTELGEGRFEYLSGYAIGLVDSIEILTFEDTKEIVNVGMQRLGLS